AHLADGIGQRRHFAQSVVDAFQTRGGEAETINLSRRETETGRGGEVALVGGEDLGSAFVQGVSGAAQPAVLRGAADGRQGAAGGPGTAGEIGAVRGEVHV